MTINELKSSLKLPIIIAPMFLVSGTKLVIEACKKGVLATFPSLNGRTSEDFENMLIEINSELYEYQLKTGIKPAPYGVNIIVNKSNSRVFADLEICKKYKVPLIITSLGAVKDIVEIVHDYGGIVFHDVIKKRHAEKAAEAGVDGIIAVSAGAGGHSGTYSPFAFVKEIKNFYKGAVILAGSISSGNDVLAAENIGADFVYMGTKFIATNESLASNEYKNMLLDSKINDIIYTNQVTGVNANFIKKTLDINQIDYSINNSESILKPENSEKKAWKNVWSAGHGVTDINEIKSVSEIIDELIISYENTLKSNIDKFNLFKNKHL